MYSTGLTQPQQESLTALTVVLERSPSALARVCSVLCLMNLVPESFGGTQVGDDAVRIEFLFGPEPDRRLDLLARKLAQLTECLEVTPTRLRRQAAL